MVFSKRVSAMIKQDWNSCVIPSVGSSPQCCLLQIICDMHIGAMA